MSTEKKTQRKKARLGRGLGALLGERQHFPQNTHGDQHAQLQQLPIEQLQRGKYQPRTIMHQSALQELAETIRTQGVIQPLLVRRIEQNQFEILAGERRWRAAQLAGLATVPAIIKQVSEQNAMVVALIENIQREDLGVIEEAVGLRRLLDEFGLTHQQVAEVIGRSRAAVSNLLRLLTLHPAVKKLLEDGKLEMGHARTLLALPAAAQAKAGNQVAAKRLSVRQTELLVKRLLAGDSHAPGGTSGASKDSDILRLEGELSARIGAQVSIEHRSKKGRLVIHYHSLDELDGILSHIK